MCLLLINYKSTVHVSFVSYGHNKVLYSRCLDFLQHFLYKVGSLEFDIWAKDSIPLLSSSLHNQQRLEFTQVFCLLKSSQIPTLKG